MPLTSAARTAAGTLRLTLVAHASTAATRAVAFPHDDHLDGFGLRRTRAAQAPFAGALCLTSPAAAARQTAEAMGLAARTEPALRDVDYGTWSGRTLDAVASENPDGIALWLTDPSAAPHGGESLDALIRRVAAWLDGCAAGRIVAVTHAVVIKAAVVHLLDAPANAIWRLDVAPLSITRLHSNGARWLLRSFNQPARRRSQREAH